MQTTKYRGILLDGRAVELTVSGSRITGSTPIDATASLPRLLPALVDIQQNGALTFAFNNITEESAPQLHKIAAHLKKNCVGRVLATFTTTDYPRLERAAAALNKIFKADQELETLFAGIFHEGVFISPDKGWRGGHCPEFILAPDYERFSRLNELSGHRVKVVNVAPETEGGLDFVRKAASSGVRVALGHCHPDAATIHKAADCGATLITHFANGSAPEIHRFNNPFWGFLDEERLAPGLVGDGFHLPPEVVRTVIRCKGEDNCFMVSDANIYSGCAPGLYHRIGGLDCVIEENGFIHVAGQEILAGAYFQQNRSVSFLTETCGVAFASAWKMCSVIPAKLAGIELPMLNPGEEATFVVYPDQGEPQLIFRGEK
ncbi:MAG: hypothetical protein IKC65_09755 [Lentisphaeria bacterium]|nr:hypothetical protein [Lentisphaeria bacterium]